MLTRRGFLKLGGAGAIVVTGGAMMPLFASQAFSSGQIGAQVAGGNRTLVIIELAGGNDGLNTVVPFGDPRYYELRPTLGIEAQQVHKLNSQIGLHPQMRGLYDLYQQGRMAIVQGVGYPNFNYSHFEASDIWQSAQLDQKTRRTGWIGRWIGEQGRPGLATSVTGDLPLALYNQTTLAPAIRGLEDFYWQSDDLYSEGDGQKRTKLAREIYKRVGSDKTIEYVRASALDALATADAIQKQTADFKPDNNYPDNNDLAFQLKAVAQLLASGVDFRVFYTRISGFDTHSSQLDQHAALLSDLSAALAAFMADLKKRGWQDNVVVMTFSEFGRRPQENGSGTDHGSAQPMLLLGGKLRGGLYGQTPSLTDLDNGNLKAGLDFRQVYATVLERWLGVPARAVLTQPWPLLNLF